MTSPDFKERAGPEYASNYEALVRGQDERKFSLEQRGLAVITTSGTLATLLFGLVALATKSNDFRLPVRASGPLAVALGAFAAAALLALLTMHPSATRTSASRIRRRICGRTGTRIGMTPFSASRELT
jgi:hypothetical protein